MATQAVTKSDAIPPNPIPEPRTTVTVMVIRPKEFNPPQAAAAPPLLPLPGRPATSCASHVLGPSAHQGYLGFPSHGKPTASKPGMLFKAFVPAAKTRAKAKAKATATANVNVKAGPLGPSLLGARQNSTPKLEPGPGPGPYGLAPPLKRRGTCNSILGPQKPGNKENYGAPAVVSILKQASKERGEKDNRCLQIQVEKKPGTNFVLARTLSNTHKILSERLRLGPNGVPLKPKLDVRRVNASACEVRARGLEDYDVGKQLGQGAYASVKEAVQKSTKRRVALKIYENYRLLEPQRKNSVIREISLLKKLDHTNIVKLYETINTSRQTILVMELVKGRSLHAYLKSREGRKLPEPEVRSLFKQVVAGISYCHQKGIAHRDIKLDNLLLDERHNVKIIDFGFSTSVQPGTKLKVFCGTPSYMAPEIVNKLEYRGPPADMWALGVLLYVMLCGCHPFKAASDRELFRKIAKGDYPMPQHLSCSARQLINKLLQVDPQRRLTSEEVSHHPFLTPRDFGSSYDSQLPLLRNGWTIDNLPICP